MRAAILSLLLVLPLLAGCMGGDDGAPAAVPGVAASAEDAGAKSGPSPSAPKDPYQVTMDETTAEGSTGKTTTATAYPVSITTNEAKEPVVLDFSGVFEPAACSPTGISLPVPMGPRQFHWNDFRDSLSTGDVFSYSVEMRYNNTDSEWAELHLFYGVGAVSDYWREPTSEVRGEVVMNFTGQSYRVDDEDNAWAGAACWYGSITQPLPYTLTVTLTFAEAAVPSGAPVLLKVPQNATRLFVRGVAIDPAEGVNSHYRIFGPDDGLVCECGLNSNQETAAFVLPGPGDYVLLVDHTSNGFVSFALDAPSSDALRPLDAEWAFYVLASGDGGPVDETATVELPTIPLSMSTWVFPPGFTEGEMSDAGFGRAVSVTVSNARGDVLRQKLGGYVTSRLVVPDLLWTNDWFPMGLPGDEWEFFEDHHAYNVGAHQVTVKADQMRGDAVLFAVHYVRP